MGCLTNTRHLGEVSVSQLNGSLEFQRDEAKNTNWVVTGTWIILSVGSEITRTRNVDSKFRIEVSGMLISRRDEPSQRDQRPKRRVQ